jgi:hypothetical protein
MAAIGRAVVSLIMGRRCHAPTVRRRPPELNRTLVVAPSGHDLAPGLRTNVALRRTGRRIPIVRWSRHTCGMGGSSSDNWLDQGHGDGESLVPVAGVPSRDMAVSSDRGSAGWHSRSGKAVIAALAAAALIGSAGTAYAVRETLFPSLGSPTSPSVWANPVPASVPAETTVPAVTSSTSTTTSTVPVTVPADTVPPVTTLTSVPAGTSPAVVSNTVTTVEDNPEAGHGKRAGSPKIEDSEDHATTTESVANTGPSVPETVETTPEHESGGSSESKSGSGGDSDNSGSRHSGTDDDRSKSDD